MREKNTTGEAPEEIMKVDIPMYHDVWLDNGVVNLYRALLEGVRNEDRR